MEKLKVEEFRAIKQRIQEIFKEFKSYLEDEELSKSLSKQEQERIEERLDAAEEEISNLITSLRNYNLSEISFEEWNDFEWLTNEYNLEGTDANLDFALINTYDSNGVCRFKGCNVRNFNFESIRYDDDSFDEKFKEEHSEHFLSKEITDPEVRTRYYNNNLTIEDIVVWNFENVPIKRFSYNDRVIIERIGLERAKTIDQVLINKLGYKIYDYLEDESLTDEMNIEDFIISKIEEDMKERPSDADKYAEIPLVKERLKEYFIDFGESSERNERLNQNYKTKHLFIGQIVANYDIFEGKKYAHTLYVNDHNEKQITEEQIDKFYQEMKEIIPSLLKIGISWEDTVEGYSTLETEEDKKTFLAEVVKKRNRENF